MKKHEASINYDLDRIVERFRSMARAHVFTVDQTREVLGWWHTYLETQFEKDLNLRHGRARTEHLKILAYAASDLFNHPDERIQRYAMNFYKCISGLYEKVSMGKKIAIKHRKPKKPSHTEIFNDDLASQITLFSKGFDSDDQDTILRKVQEIKKLFGSLDYTDRSKIIHGIFKHIVAEWDSHDLVETTEHIARSKIKLLQVLAENFMDELVDALKKEEQEACEKKLMELEAQAEAINARIAKLHKAQMAKVLHQSKHWERASQVQGSSINEQVDLLRKNLAQINETIKDDEYKLKRINGYAALLDPIIAALFVRDENIRREDLELFLIVVLADDDENQSAQVHRSNLKYNVKFRHDDAGRKLPLSMEDRIERALIFIKSARYLLNEQKQEKNRKEERAIIVERAIPRVAVLLALTLTLPDEARRYHDMQLDALKKECSKINDPYKIAEKIIEMHDRDNEPEAVTEFVAAIRQICPDGSDIHPSYKAGGVSEYDVSVDPGP